MKPNLDTTSWVTFSFLWSSTCNAASARSSSPKSAKFTIWIDCHYVNEDHISVLREIMELDKWAPWYQWQWALQQFGANPTENGLFKLWKAVPPCCSQCKLGLFSRLLRADKCRDVICVYVRVYRYVCVCVCWNQADWWNSQPADTFWVVTLFVLRYMKARLSWHKCKAWLWESTCC